MNWFIGEVSTAIQKAISEKKIFIVFVKDDTENSTKMDEIWSDSQVSEVCSDDKCVAISISSGSIPAQQFSAIYPVLVVPSTYLINNQGIPTDIIPGAVEKEEFLKRLQNTIDKSLSVSDPESTVTEEASDNTKCADGEVASLEEEITSNLAAESVDLGETILSSETFNDDFEAELTPQEKSQIEMLREKLKLKREEEEKEKLKEMERKRRETGHELQMAQRDIAERQAINLAKEIADRKLEDKVAREKVKEQIRQDRLEKTQRFDREKKEREALSKRKSDAVTAEAEKKKADMGNTARLLFRLPDGSSVSNVFNSEAKFFLAESFIKDHLKSESVRLTTVYPRHEFTSEDMLKSFRDLGLVPNASIIVSLTRQVASTKSMSSFNPMSIIMFFVAPLLAILNWITSVFTTTSNDQNQENQDTTPSSYVAPSSRDDSVRRRNVPAESPLRGNMHILRRGNDDDENATWNGNSTQQM